MILSINLTPLVSGKKKVRRIIIRDCPTLSHIKKEEGTFTSRAETTVARRPKVLARPNARPRICVG